MLQDLHRHMFPKSQAAHNKDCPCCCLIKQELLSPCCDYLLSAGDDRDVKLRWDCSSLVLFLVSLGMHTLDECLQISGHDRHETCGLIRFRRGTAKRSSVRMTLGVGSLGVGRVRPEHISCSVRSRPVISAKDSPKYFFRGYLSLGRYLFARSWATAIMTSPHFFSNYTGQPLRERLLLIPLRVCLFCLSVYVGCF